MRFVNAHCLIRTSLVGGRVLRSGRLAGWKRKCAREALLAVSRRLVGNSSVDSYSSYVPSPRDVRVPRVRRGHVCILQLREDGKLCEVLVSCPSWRNRRVAVMSTALKALHTSAHVPTVPRRTADALLHRGESHAAEVHRQPRLPQAARRARAARCASEPDSEPTGRSCQCGRPSR